MTCGNGVLDPGEQCDDGNKMAGDGCSAALPDVRGLQLSDRPAQRLQA